MILAQAGITSTDLLAKWISGEGGMLGMSLILNVVLVFALRYLNSKNDNATTKMLSMAEEYAKNNERVFAQVLDSARETTASLTEVVTIVKSIAEGVRK